MNGITDIKRVMNVYDVRMPAVVRMRGLNPWFKQRDYNLRILYFGHANGLRYYTNIYFALCIIVLKSHARISEYD